MNLHPGHFIALIGGACAGSEAAFRLAERGIYVAVFEQQALPHGKIEDGLPKWHVKLRNKEESKIDGKISHPNVFYVPNTKLGRDIQFEDLMNNWGFSAVMLASGAWRDRPLPVEGIDEFIGRGFYYQNPFVDWFNHHHEPEYNRFEYGVMDNALVVGGGLASIDVVKILMLETTVAALAERGIKSDVLSLEHKGIPKTLEALGVKFEDLGIKGCKLFYRRRNIDMPLGPMPPNATPERIAKLQQVRVKILANAQRDYLFHFEERCKPIDLIVEDDRLAGLVFRKTEVVDGRVKDVDGSEFEVRSPLTISSIGSIPEKIPGIPTKGELFIISDEDTGKFDDYDEVFAVGNAVTGRGNIRESEVHSRKVVQQFMDNFLQWTEDDYNMVSEQGWDKLSETGARRTLTEDEVQAVINRISEAQQRAGYDGNYEKWAEAHRPVRLEDQIAKEA